VGYASFYGTPPGSKNDTAKLLGTATSAPVPADCTFTASPGGSNPGHALGGA
jgi:hypothetical protein